MPWIYGRDGNRDSLDGWRMVRSDDDDDWRREKLLLYFVTHCQIHYFAYSPHWMDQNYNHLDDYDYVVVVYPHTHYHSVSITTTMMAQQVANCLSPHHHHHHPTHLDIASSTHSITIIAHHSSMAISPPLLHPYYSTIVPIAAHTPFGVVRTPRRDWCRCTRLRRGSRRPCRGRGVGLPWSRVSMLWRLGGGRGGRGCRRRRGPWFRFYMVALASVVGWKLDDENDDFTRVTFIHNFYLVYSHEIVMV